MEKRGCKHAPTHSDKQTHTNNARLCDDANGAVVRGLDIFCRGFARQMGPNGKSSRVAHRNTECY